MKLPRDLLGKHGRRDVMSKPAISPNYTPQLSENFLLIIFNFCVYILIVFGQNMTQAT